MTLNPQIVAARTAGYLAGMEPPRPRIVPAEFNAVSAIWLDAYDGIVCASRSSFDGETVAFVMEPAAIEDELPPTPPPVRRLRRASAPAKSSRQDAE